MARCMHIHQCDCAEKALRRLIDSTEQMLNFFVANMDLWKRYIDPRDIERIEKATRSALAHYRD